jgi:hypothetical protein
VQIMELHKGNQLLVVDERCILVGAIKMLEEVRATGM